MPLMRLIYSSVVACLVLLQSTAQAFVSISLSHKIERLPKVPLPSRLFKLILFKRRPSCIQGGPKKTAPNFSCNNFGKYGPILIMFSLLHSQMN